MVQDQSVDAHSGQPYATLIDDVEGGVFDRNGGPHESYPHHARDLVFWNFRHNAQEEESYNFWSTTNRTGNTYADPFFIGFQSNQEVTFENEGLNEMAGTMVEPRSLFEAQLNLSLTADESLPSVTFLSPGYGENFDKNSSISPEVSASDPDGSVAYVNLYINGELVEKVENSPYRWNTNGSEQDLLSNLSANNYVLKAEVVDNDSNRTNNEIEIIVGRKPVVEIIRPVSTKIIEVNENVEVEVTASDSDGSIATVELYLNDELISTKSERPFLWGTDESIDPQLFNLSAEEYSLKAVAIDDDGLSMMDIQNFVVNIPPTLSFSTPAATDSFQEGANIQVNIGASDPDGSISTVKLYLDGEFLGRDNSVPYTWGFDEDDEPELFNMEAGEYVLRAEATDSRGSKRSDSMNIVVEAIVPLASKTVEDNQVKIYPNPFNDFIVLESNESPQKILLMNNLGKVISSLEVEKNGLQHKITFDKQLTDGLYFLYVLYSDSEVVLKVLR
jgi:hypothetical protein